MTHPFWRGDNSENTLLTFKKIFFSRSNDLISTSLGTKHPLVLGIQVCANEGPHPSSRGDNSENTLTTPEPLVQFQPNLALSNHWWRGFKFVQMKGHTLSKGRLYGLLTASGSILIVCSRKYFTGEQYNPLTSCFLFAAEAMKNNGSHWSKCCKEKSTWQIKKIENKLLSCYNWSGDRITLMII